MELGPCSGASVATHLGVVVGFHRYQRDVKFEIMYSAGTWVHPGYRKSALGVRMWECSIKKQRPKIIFVHTSCKQAHKMVDKIKSNHSSIEWHHDRG